MTSGSEVVGSAASAQLKAVPVRHPGRWVTVVVLAVLFAMLMHTLVVNPAWQWHLFAKYFFTGTVMHGLLATLELTVLAMLIGVVLGTIIAIMRLSPNPVVSGAAWIYVWFFRGTPILVQIVFWSFIASLYPYLSLGIPFGHEFVIFNSNKLIPLFLGVVLGLGLNEAAYMAEIVRAGILSVDSGQTEAASALGMRRLDIMQRIVLPQAMRVVIPPTGNETISMLKTTSLAAFASFVELFKATQDISANIFKQIPLLMVASVWYLIFTSVLSAIQYYIERYYARGSSRQLPATPVQRVRAFMAQRADQSGSI
jgi:polar amino acid transport system permease protein